MMKTLVLAHHQAAVGKSTVATMLVHHLARHGHRVLAIDLDHPGTMGLALRRSRKVAALSLAADALTGDVIPDLPDAAGQSITLIDGARRWIGMEREPRRCDNFICNLQDMVAIYRRRFDACVIDTSGLPDVRLFAALSCADLVVVPTRLDDASLRAVDRLVAHERCGIARIKATLNPSLRFIGLLPTMVEFDDCPQARRNRFARIAAQHTDLLIRLGALASACSEAKPGRQISEFACVPRSRELAQTLASGQMPWEIPATSARAAWNEVKPSIEALAGQVTACVTAMETRS